MMDCFTVSWKHGNFNVDLTYKNVHIGGGFYLLGVQLLTAVCLASWSAIITFLLLYVSDKKCIYLKKVISTIQNLL